MGRWAGRIDSNTLARFCRLWSQSLSGGVDLNRTLATLEQRFGQSGLGSALGVVRRSLQGGATLVEALEDSGAFDSFFVSLMRVAEARGGYAETLRELADHYERRHRLIRTARGALIQPAIVLALAFLVTILVASLALPAFASLLTDLGDPNGLPWVSRALIALSDFMTVFGWWLIPAGVIGLVLLGRLWYATPPGKASLDALAARLPVFGGLARLIDKVRFARSLSVLLDGGLPPDQALELTAGTLNLTGSQRIVEDLRQAVLDGEEMSPVLRIRAEDWWGPELADVVENGEETGQLPEALARQAKVDEHDLEQRVKNLSTLVKPLITIALGLLVLFIVLAVVVPYISVLQNLAGGS